MLWYQAIYNKRGFLKMDKRSEKGESSNSYGMKLKKIFDLLRCGTKQQKPEDISSSKFTMKKDAPHIPSDIQMDICKRVLAENFLDIYENTHNRCAAIEFLEMSGDKSVALKFAKLLGDEHFGKDYETHLRMISAIGRLGDQSVVPELLNKLSSETSYYTQVNGAIAGVAVMLDSQLAVPKLCEMLSDKAIFYANRATMAFAIGMSGDQSARQTLNSILSSNPNIDREVYKAITNAIELSDSPSVGPGLFKAISDMDRHIWIRNTLPCIAGKLGDISVARELVEMLSCYEKNINYEFDKIPRAIVEIGSRSGNSEEVKELSSKLLDLTYKEIFRYQELMLEIPKAVGELGKRLKPEDGKELSDKLVARLFDERIHKEVSPAIANAVFELEQHLAEPDPFNRLLDQGKARRKACEKIKEEILKHRQQFTDTGKDISEFYEMLSKAAFSNGTRKEMRIWVFYPIMKTADPSFAPKLKQLVAIENHYQSIVSTKEGWVISNEEQQRMRKLAHDLRNRPSSDAENLSQ
jgi:hypothetical protein